MSEKIIRDPVHDVIAFRLERPAEALLFRLLNAAEFQRLRRIRQLGLASLAYPGADHSRYSHSLGVMETARTILAQLRQSYYIPEEDVGACLVAALLHDLGHGPFSHVFERISGVNHETLTERVILESDSEVNQVLVDHDRGLPARIADLMNARPRRTFIADILSSQLDADRLDYLLRDNLMTGSQYGNYDLRWLVHALVIDDSSNRLAISRKGVSAVEAYLQSRYHMYRNVYFHKVVRSAEGMVKLALERAKLLADAEQLEWPAGKSAVRKALSGEILSMSEFAGLDDVSVQHCFKVWSDSPDETLSGLCRGLMQRKLFKTIDLSHVAPAEARDGREAVERAIRSAGGEPDFDVFLDEVSDASGAPDSSEILVRDHDGTLRPLTAFSPLPAMLGRQLNFRRLHVAPRWRDLASQAVRKT